MGMKKEEPESRKTRWKPCQEGKVGLNQVRWLGTEVQETLKKSPDVDGEGNLTVVDDDSKISSLGS